MANLETLELTISANAQSASQGLNNLINSLTSLSGKVKSAVDGLKKLNSELATLKSNSKVKIPAITDSSDTKAVKNAKATTKKIEEQVKAIKEWQKGAREIREATRQQDATDVWSEAKERQMNPQWFTDYSSEAGKAKIIASAAVRKRNEIFAELKKATDYSDLREYIDNSLGIGKEVKSAAESASVFAQQMGEKVPLLDRVKNKFNDFKTGFKNLGAELKGLIPKFTALHKVMRIASTMLIRMGLRALFKGIKEGFNNYYQYSKTTGGAFAKEMDSLSSAWAQLKNQMGAAIAPTIGAVIPILNAITSAAISAFNALSQLFALLGGKNSWSKATAQITAFDAAAKKAGGGGGGANELLAKFDELNLIANEGGGGGGGGVAGEEFATMFEEMWDFDSKIRALADFIRETISWVKENFTVLLETAGLIGVAILGWKISKAFEGVLSTIGSWIAGGALITLGIILDFDFGKKLGSSLAGGASLKWLDVVEGIGGVIAAGIGGYLIGGTAGLAVGVAVSIIATIVGIVVGVNDQLDKLKWGDTALTPEQIQQYVQSKFNFDIEAEVTLMKGSLKTTKATKLALDLQIAQFSRDLNKIQIGVDTSPKALETAIADADIIVEKLKDHLTSSADLISVLMKSLNYDESTQTKIGSHVFNADNKIMAYVEEQGKKIADAFDRGMSSGWKNNEAQEIIDLLAHLENIYSAADESKALSKYVATSKMSLRNMTRDTATEILNAEKEALETYGGTIADLTQQAYEDMLYRAELAEQMGMPEVSRQLKADAETLLNSYQDKTKEKLASAKEVMKKDWENTLNEVYGADYSKKAKHYASQMVGSIHAAYQDSTEWGRSIVLEFLNNITDVGITKEASEMFGISGWDLLTADAKAHFVKGMYTAIGFDAVKELKAILKISASELISVTNWQAFSSTEKLQFIKALSDAYGTTEALRVAKAAGINVGQAITDGVASKDGNAREAARSLVHAIDDELRQRKISVGVDASLEVKIDALVNVTPVVQEAINNAKETVSDISTTASGVWSNIKNFASSIFKASGAYGVPAGDVFIANEQGAELVGSINGKTSVANQEQIIQGIQRGVSEANAEQNNLLRQQNALLQSILEKDSSVRIGASVALGRVARQSLDMYGSMVGG